MIAQNEFLETVKEHVSINGKRFDNPEFIETNSSLILFVENQAWKIIKEEKGEEYSNLQDRCIWLIEEMFINSEISPDLYLGIGRIHVDNAVEYALGMKKLEEKSLVYNMLLKGSYLKEHSLNIACKIANFHFSKLTHPAQANNHDSMKKYCSYDALRDVIHADFKRFERYKEIFMPAALTEENYQKIKNYVLNFLRDKRKLLIERAKTGYVLSIHGDFHARNIFVENNSVYVIDRALRKQFRINDIVKDPAYFSVDLQAFGLRKEMQYFLDVYQEKVADPFFEELLPFYICRLGLVGGMVHFSEGNPLQAKPYFDVALHYAEC